MNTLLTKIAAYKKALDTVDEINKHLDVAKETANQLKDEICQEMTQEEVDSISYDGYTYSLQSKTKYSKKAGMEPELFQVLRNNNLGDLIQEGVNPMRFNSAMNQEAENNGGELPECYADLVNVYSFLDISKRKKAK